MATPGKRAFWLHQAAEYLLGAVFVAQGLQSPTPAVPSIVGGLVMLNTACAKGSLSAFRLFGRRTHRALDLVVIVVAIVAAVQPVIDVDTGTRLIMLLLAAMLAFIWWQSDFSERVTKADRSSVGASGAGDDVEPNTADQIGRLAGRAVGRGVNAYRARRQR